MKLPFPPGHFYSPIVDTEALAKERARVWPSDPQVAGIDFDDDSHRHLLQDVLPRQLPAYDYPETLPDSDTLSSFYTRSIARCLSAGKREASNGLRSGFPEIQSDAAMTSRMRS